MIQLRFCGYCTFCDVVIDCGMPGGGENPRSRVPVRGNMVVSSKQVDLWKSFKFEEETRGNT